MSVRFILAALGLLGSSAQAVAAQTGALFLLVPFGARAVAVGEAVSADTTLGSEGLWWNAAALSRLPQREAAIHFSKTQLANSLMFAFAVPSRVFGTLAIGGYDVNYGDQQATDQFNGQPIGVISNHNSLLAVSYATPVGQRLGIGLSYKFDLGLYVTITQFPCVGRRDGRRVG